MPFHLYSLVIDMVLEMSVLEQNDAMSGDFL